MSLKLYEIDRRAHDLVLSFRDRDVLGESHKMRMTTAFGLERFWGEQLRLQRESRDKAEFWKETWKTLHSIMKSAGVNLPNDTVNANDTGAIQAMSEKLWSFDVEQRKVTLSILSELCDSMVWWTQRYKKSSSRPGE